MAGQRPRPDRDRREHLAGRRVARPRFVRRDARMGRAPRRDRRPAGARRPCPRPGPGRAPDLRGRSRRVRCREAPIVTGCTGSDRGQGRTEADPTEPTHLGRGRRPMGRWTAVAILAAAQFVMVLDSSVMNVSISQIVEDLGTTIAGVQLAITAYTLVMAAFMLIGAKIGDVWGREKAFAVGLAVYACGSFTTAISPNLGVLLFG